MNEVNEPMPSWGGFRDSSNTFDKRLVDLRQRRRVRVADELASISGMRAAAHSAVNLFRDFYVGTVEHDTEELRHELNSAETALARWAILCAHEEFYTVDLARIENHGDWKATAAAEADIASIAGELRTAGDGGQMIDRRAPEAKRRIMIDPTLVTASGLVAVRRKRLMLATASREVRFRDGRAGRKTANREMVARSHVEIDKVSEFVLDLTVLRRIHRRAAAEIDSAIETMGPVELTNHGRNLVSPRLIEAAIDVRHPMLVPAITTYFADRKYDGVTAVGSEKNEPAQTAMGALIAGSGS